jgi:hypothetical protein
MTSRRKSAVPAFAGWLVLGILLWQPARASGHLLPQADGQRHLGVASCAGSLCHGAAEPQSGSDILQNEYLTWHRDDRHAEAWNVLLGKRSRAIGEKLGIAHPEQSDRCLGCHSDAVPANLRGKRFQVSDGIGCEACHGGAEHWIDSHTDPKSDYAGDVARGMYPTADPTMRARLCVSCHYSQPASPMSHEIMAAGHPPLLFELDTFTTLQPAHFRVDADYRRRKPAASHLTTWLTGQAVLAASMMDHWPGAPRAGKGESGFPEFYPYNCYACHHNMFASGWAGLEQRITPVSGRIPLADAPLRMIADAGDVLASRSAADLRQALVVLHARGRPGDDLPSRMLSDVAQILGNAQDRSDGTANRRIVLALIDRMQGGDFADPLSDQQALMALEALLPGIPSTPAQSANRRHLLDTLYAQFSRPDSFSAWRFRHALQALRATF